MRFTSYCYRNQNYIGVLSADQLQAFDLTQLLNRPFPGGMNDFIASVSAEELKIVNSFLEAPDFNGHPVAQVHLNAPITKPIHDILCVGLNYKAHVAEATAALKNDQLNQDKKPILFGKRALRILGPDEPLQGQFELDAELDYESELAVIIGKSSKNIAPEQALDHIFGYSIFNDFSSRTLQRDHVQWLKGKSLDGYSALGPFIVTPDEFDINSELSISCEVNGELRQNSRISQMIYDIPRLISELSAGMTLEAGDIIATGTPSGVGMGLNPPSFLKPGDEVICKIEKLGALRTPIH